LTQEVCTVIDPALLLEQPDTVIAALARKGVSADTVRSARDALIHRRSVLTETERLRAEMNRRSKELGKLFARPSSTRARCS
jgi:seryl-tRNA synthetase